MKAFLALVAMCICLMPVVALTEPQSAYINGMNIGWELSYARGVDAAAYNALAQKYNDALNATMNSSEASQYWLAFVAVAPKGPIKIGSGKASTVPGPVNDVPRIHGMPAEAYYSMGPSDAELSAIAGQMGLI
jgi:hypothetical protein